MDLTPAPISLAAIAVVLDHTSDGFLIVSPTGEIEYANAAAGRSLGIGADAVRGRQLRDLMGGTLTPLAEACSRALADNASTKAEGQAPDGRWIEASVYPVPGRLVVLLRDVTEARTIAADLERARATFQGIVSIASEAIISVDASQRIIFFNRGAEEIFGYTEAEAAGQPLSILIPEAFRRSHEDQVRQFAVSRVTARRMGERGQIMGRRKDGELFPAEASISKLEIDGSWIYTAVLRDVTERTRAEQELRLLQTLTRAIGEASDLDEALRVALRQVCETTGWVLGEAWVPGRDDQILELSHVSYARVGGLERFVAAGRGLTTRRGEGLAGRAWGTRRPKWSRDVAQLPEFSRKDVARELGIRTAVAFPVLAHEDVVAVIVFYSTKERDEDARLVALVRAVAAQLGELILRKRAEDAVAQHARELARSNAELEQFASVASHDLQEPLRKIQAFGSRLAASAGTGLDERSRDYLARMLNAAERMQALINDLLAFSRITTKAQPFVAVDLNEVVRRTLGDLEVSIQESGARVELEELPVIDADPLQMRQLFQNLIGNALKFRRPGEPAVVRVYAARPDGDVEVAAGDVVVIHVKDEGIGFDEKYLDRIFNPFQRLHGRGEYEGTGMGLAICRKIAERHGGEITARSAPGRGSDFIITLPVRQHEK